VVTVKEKHTDGFFMVETSNGKTGWVAASAIRIAVVLKAVHAFDDVQSEDELPLKEGDIVCEMLEPEDGWCYGMVPSTGQCAGGAVVFCHLALMKHLCSTLISSHSRCALSLSTSPREGWLFPDQPCRTDGRTAAGATDLARAVAVARVHRACHGAGPRVVGGAAAGAGAGGAARPTEPSGNPGTTRRLRGQARRLL